MTVCAYKCLVYAGLIFVTVILYPVAGYSVSGGGVHRDDVRHLFPRRTNDTRPERRYPEEFYQKIYNFLSNTYQFRNLTYEEMVDMTENVLSYNAPREIQENFPYYLAGYDDEDRPIWIAEVGKYNIRKWTEKGTEGEIELERFLHQAGIRVLQSFFAKDRPGRELREGMFIFDCQGFTAAQVTHEPTIRFALKQIQLYRDVVEKALGEIIVINGFFVTEVAINFIRPLVGSIMEKVTIFGSNKNKWTAELRHLFPPHAIPSWYGGSKDFSPLEVYG